MHIPQLSNHLSLNNLPVDLILKLLAPGDINRKDIVQMEIAVKLQTLLNYTIGERTSNERQNYT